MAANNDTRNYTIIAVILIIIILLIVFWDKLKAAIAKKTATIPPSQTNASGSDGAAPLDYNKILKRGDRGEEVKLLQRWLGVTADGIFGPITESALLQKKGINNISLTEYSTMPDMNWTNPGEPQFMMSGFIGIENAQPPNGGVMNGANTNDLTYIA